MPNARRVLTCCKQVCVHCFPESVWAVHWVPEVVSLSIPGHQTINRKCPMINLLRCMSWDDNKLAGRPKLLTTCKHLLTVVHEVLGAILQQAFTYSSPRGTRGHITASISLQQSTRYRSHITASIYLQQSRSHITASIYLQQSTKYQEPYYSKHLLTAVHEVPGAILHHIHSSTAIIKSNIALGYLKINTSSMGLWLLLCRMAL